jgi:hypothetical protein
MRYAPRDIRLGRKISTLLAQGKKGVVFLGRGGAVLAEVGSTDFGQYDAVRKAQIDSPELKAIAYLNLGDQLQHTALVENYEDPEPFLAGVAFDIRSHWFEPLPDAMATTERRLGKEVIEEEDDN